MSHTVLHLIQHYGYAGLFVVVLVGIVGLPIPIELMLLGAGSLALKAHLSLPGVICCAWVGACVGMLVNYTLGRTIGLERLSRVTRWVHLPKERLLKWSDVFSRYGSLILMLGYYVAGLRHASPFIAGASRMPLPRFAGLSCFGALAWIMILVMLGHKFGHQWHHLLNQLHKPVWLLAAFSLLAGYWLVKIVLRWRRFS
ncbi:DedA family protein [Paenibacillus athensensis]|uniref:VTT domain-containing protein n=1 Tax=Paenibacillus athensensis TaxID=1967502 RepID=A0A4Y8Q084_9BACL|nr:DedA family protein [Paenibacillus athensensis]MCD1261137.1 DedA family protein [Paenibacillus athensensis]